MCPVKETRFFADVWDEAAQQGTLDEELARYRSLFDDDAPVLGETDPRYFWHPEVPERIEATLEDPRFVVSLRDPIERAHSLYRVDVRAGTPTEPFLDRVRDEIRRLDGDPRTYPLLRGSLYHRQLARFVDRFGRDRVHVVLFEDLREDAAAVLRDVARFLEVDPAGVERVDHGTVHNPSGTPRSRALYDLVHREGPIRSIARRVLPERVRIWVGDHLLVRTDDGPRMDPEAAELLEEVLVPEVEAAEELLGMDLSERWGMGRVGD